MRQPRRHFAVSKSLNDEALFFTHLAFSQFQEAIHNKRIMFCSIEYIRITPNPPVKGEDLTVDFKGFLKEEVNEGSMIDVLVKYGAIKLLHKQFDLCEQAQQVNRTCPIEEGDFHLIHTVELPKDIPPVSLSMNNCGFYFIRRVLF